MSGSLLDSQDLLRPSADLGWHAQAAHRSERGDSGPGALANGTLVNGDPYLTNYILVSSAQPRKPDIPTAAIRRERWLERCKPRGCLTQSQKTEFGTFHCVSDDPRHGLKWSIPACRVVAHEGCNQPQRDGNSTECRSCFGIVPICKTTLNSLLFTNFLTGNPAHFRSVWICVALSKSL